MRETLNIPEPDGFAERWLDRLAEQQKHHLMLEWLLLKAFLLHRAISIAVADPVGKERLLKAVAVLAERLACQDAATIARPVEVRFAEYHRIWREWAPDFDDDLWDGDFDDTEEDLENLDRHFDLVHSLVEVCGLGAVANESDMVRDLGRQAWFVSEIVVDLVAGLVPKYRIL